LTFEIVAT